MEHNNCANAIEVKKYFAEHAQDFATTPAPRLLIQMDGCREVFVNQAHAREFRGKFPVVRDSAEITKLIGAETKQTVDRRLSNDNACYCYPMGAPVALIADHCVFDRTFQALEGSKLRAQFDIPAFLESQDDSRNVRKYRLYRSKSVRMKGEHCDYLASEILHMLDFEVHIQTDSSSEAGAPEALTATTLFKHRPLFTSKAEELGRRNDRHKDYRGAYVAVYERFSEAISRLGRSLDRKNSSERDELRESKLALLESLRNERGVEYLAVAGFINGVYSRATHLVQSAKSVRDTVTELQRMQARFYDIFALRDLVVEQVPGAIANWPHKNPVSSK